MSDQPQAEVVQAWLERARSDLQLGRSALRTRGVLPEVEAHQALERAAVVLDWVQGQIN